MSETPRIDADLVRRLIGSQFPEWADLPIEEVEPNGWDNRTFRLGAEMSVRLPSHERYAAQVDKEQTWLPRLRSSLPVPVPEPLGRGVPDGEYPWPWSVYRWLPGETAAVRGAITDLGDFATDLAGFVRALHRADALGGPRPGLHNFHRGGSLAVWDSETRAALAAVGDAVDPLALTSLWDAALASEWHREPVWVHGDLVTTNLLVRDGRLAAVIDFGCCGVGDPACDLPITWLLFRGESRALFRGALDLDRATWARARGWTLWKRLIALSEDPEDREARRVIEDLVAEHREEA